MQKKRRDTQITLVFLLCCAAVTGLWLSWLPQSDAASVASRPGRQWAEMLQTLVAQTLSAAPHSLAVAAPVVFATITVSTTADDNMVNGNCTLREAITAANTNVAVDACTAGTAGQDTIQFNLGAGTPTINVSSPLPTITDPVMINGNTGASTRVELNGAGAGPSNGLVVTAGNSTIAGLVINRFSSTGILIQTNGGNMIRNCYLGTDANGMADLGNGGDGVQVQISNNVIGGTTAGERNLISGNNRFGVFIRNSLATGNAVTGNYIGTDVTGTLALGNVSHGVLIQNASNNTVGGPTVGERNLISSNGGGVAIDQSSATGNKVIGNYLGTDVSGTADLGNTANGVEINSASNNTVGGTNAAERNLISGNNVHGVNILGATASGNKVSGNYIGTDANGTADLGNSGDGVQVQTSNNVIGGTTAGERNLISGNNRFGVFIRNSLATGNAVTGNYIGTDVTGALALGNVSHGVLIQNASNNTVGGPTVGERNLISGNGSGVAIDQSPSTGNKVIGNYIGTDVTGTADLGNLEDGVQINLGSNNTVGGTNAAERNLISGNDRIGVNVLGATGTGNSILGNSIFNNAMLGIDLGNNSVTSNDVGDSDAGPNNLQNFPVLTCLTNASGTTTINGTLNSLPTTMYRIEFFVNDVCDTSGNGEGQIFLGFLNITTDASGNTSFMLPVPSIAVGKFITATATRLDAMSNPVETSEFSPCLVVSAPTLTINDVTLAEGNAGTTNFVFTVTLVGAMSSCLPVTVNYATAIGAAVGSDYTTTTGTLTFNPPHASNSVTQTITVQVTGETTFELDETFYVNLSGATNATLADDQGLGTITNDDAQPTFAINDVTFAEGNAGTTAANFIVTLTPGSGLTATVNYETSNGTATAGSDYQAASGVLSFASGETSKALTVLVNGDLTSEANETFFVNLSNPTNATLAPTPSLTQSAEAALAGAQGIATIQNDDGPAVGPGLAFSDDGVVSDQKPGSVLFYNLVSSSASNAANNNTRISLTNTHQLYTAYVHMFFVDGASCAIADSYICLTPNQTASFLHSDVDPGTTGYIVAVATDRNGCPINFNYLIGDEFVKLSSGHAANLAAESIGALAGNQAACDTLSEVARLDFNGTMYNALPRVLAASSLPSRADGNDTLLVINRLGGNLATGAATLGSLFGILYDDAEKAFSFSLPAGTCQSLGSLTNERPRVVPRYDQVIAAGRSGWLKLYGGTDIGIFGAQINRNAYAASNTGAFNQGHNLHKLTLTTTPSVTIPIFPPSC